VYDAEGSAEIEELEKGFLAEEGARALDATSGMPGARAVLQIAKCVQIRAATLTIGVSTTSDLIFAGIQLPTECINVLLMQVSDILVILQLNYDGEQREIILPRLSSFELRVDIPQEILADGM
jgi:hypothetical protein